MQYRPHTDQKIKCTFKHQAATGMRKRKIAEYSVISKKIKSKPNMLPNIHAKEMGHKSKLKPMPTIKMHLKSTKHKCSTNSSKHNKEA
jgi:hypothetical protein